MIKKICAYILLTQYVHCYNLTVMKECRQQAVIKGVVDYVRSLQTVEDVASLGAQIFGSDSDPRIKKLKVLLDLQLQVLGSRSIGSSNLLAKDSDSFFHWHRSKIWFI